MHLSTPPSGAIALLCCLMFACTSEIVDLFPDLGTEAGAEAGSSAGGASDAGNGDGASEVPDAGSSGSSGSVTTVDAMAESGADTETPEAAPEGGPTCDPLDCGEHAHCAEEASACECDRGYFADGAICREVAGTLNGQRVELPCLELSDNDALCRSLSDNPSVARIMTGDPGTTYLVTLRLRGIVELKAYEGGTATGMFSEGGVPVTDPWNVYRLEVSDPPTTYYLNRGDENTFASALDESHTVPIRSGATVTLGCDLEDHTNGSGVLVRNLDAQGDPIASPGGVEPAAQPFDGQFLQIDVTDVSVQP
jgi:hypothetical protein